MITTILWDMDNTLLSFEEAERVAIRSCFRSHGLGECTDEMIARYSVINRGYWQRLERGEITKEEVLVDRFRDFFAREGLPSEKAKSFNDEYQIRLGDTCVFMDDAFTLVNKLKQEGYRQYIITNGTKIAQDRKLLNSGLGKVMDGFFISDVIGHEKPTLGFFNAVFETLKDTKKEECLIVGDSLTSDIKGGNNAGVKCCWYNPRKEENGTDAVPDFEIGNLWEVEKLLKL